MPLSRRTRWLIGATVVAGLVLWICWTLARGGRPPRARVPAGPATAPEPDATAAGPEPDVLTTLTSGPAHPVRDLPAGTGDAAGVFTLWIGDDLVSYGRAGHASEAKPSNRAQADGVRGRVRRAARQPGAPLQRLLAVRYPALWDALDEASDQKRASRMIEDHGRVRIVRFESGADAKAALDSVRRHLDALIGD